MDIQFYGANCVTITTKEARVVIDDNLQDLGAKQIIKAGDIALFTSSHSAPSLETKLIVDYPGEYEISNISITGIALQGHLDNPDQKSVVGYKLIIGDINIFISGHIGGKLGDSQLEKIGMIDVLIVPAGGNGFTLDPVGALQVIKAIEPKLVIPTHYDYKGLNYPVPQQTLDQVLQGLAMEPKEITPKLKLKSTDLTDVTQLVVLE